MHRANDLPARLSVELVGQLGQPLVQSAPELNAGGNRDLIHKIGVTNMRIEQRIAGARLQPTFLMADVEVIATYELYNISRTKLEKLIHRVFDPARLDIEIKDRFGQPVVPHEWFLVPLFVIDEVVERIKAGTVSSFRYDPKSASLVEAAPNLARGEYVGKSCGWGKDRRGPSR
jgi:hypothetical protein